MLYSVAHTTAMQFQMSHGAGQCSASTATRRHIHARICRARSAQARAALNRDADLHEVQQAHRGVCTIYAQSILEHTQVGVSKRQVLQAATAVALSKALEAVQHPATASASGLATNTSASCSLQTSSSGLQWCDVADGQGPYPIKGAFTKTHYTAKLAANGAQFDSSYQRRQPLIFKVGEREVIEAWDVAILGSEDIPPMREGGKRLIIAPPGPLQKQGTKSLVWVVGLSEAIEEAGLELSPEGAPTSPLVFELELISKKGSRG